MSARSRELCVLGLSHHTAPIEVRERLAVPSDAITQALDKIVVATGFEEAMFLATCNRVEIYGVASEPERALREARNYLSTSASPTDLGTLLYEERGERAVRHAFRVASSLDSMVLGEPQILGQVKSSFTLANDHGTIGPLLGRCFHRAFAVAKRVRTETSIAAGTVSVASIACELARTIFGSLSGRRVLLVGAGKMSEAAARSLQKQGALLTVTNRSPEKAEQMARACNGEARPIEQLASELACADVVITSTSSPNFVVTHEMMSSVKKARRHRPLFLIDIAVPRDVDPHVSHIDNVFLYDVDDLQRVAEENLAARRKDAQIAEDIVQSEVAQFEQWRRSLEVTPTVVALRERFKSVVQQELSRTTPRLGALSADQARALEAMTDAIVNKLLHQPLTELKRGADDAEAAQLIAAVRRLFDLPNEPTRPTASSPPAVETGQLPAEPQLSPVTAPTRRKP